ncbi:pterin-4-alpha-carbinolamine dehydratase [Thermaerobacter marianensis DSM 12885]|uniref:Putative pterin-4-alpha-carbinolamine dehydratase n=1 Tax=Thermaerobacter marianensis (strain ATCC 700841 / DSM 12885 / JCM 10246 / 7p75a) TaxID=644966 RepID=E6SMR1_THEM7|nr:4a-hydroxytetrahydrobiopterin dehydratase [Thermaerobacter marianensis]ADU51553.1 pterin-4-alpha-carbinolamine dehydratase [Thermaerobacter marianensis DSM 12885]
MAQRLDEPAIRQRLAVLPGWERAGDAIRRTYRLAGFRDAVFFMNAVAALAEGMNHHPDVDIRYRQVTLTLTTHSAGGLTDRDFELAEAIERYTARWRGDQGGQEAGPAS